MHTRGVSIRKPCAACDKEYRDAAQAVRKGDPAIADLFNLAVSIKDVTVLDASSTMPYNTDMNTNKGQYE